jgi:hypothetical protein
MSSWLCTFYSRRSLRYNRLTTLPFGLFDGQSTLNHLYAVASTNLNHFQTTGTCRWTLYSVFLTACSLSAHYSSHCMLKLWWYSFKEKLSLTILFISIWHYISFLFLFFKDVDLSPMPNTVPSHWHHFRDLSDNYISALSNDTFLGLSELVNLSVFHLHFHYLMRTETCEATLFRILQLGLSPHYNHCHTCN